MSNQLPPADALRESVRLLGSQQAVADICGVTQTAVWKWLQAKKPLPAEHVLAVEAATGISRHELRPDIYPIEPPRPSVANADEQSPAAEVSPRPAAGDYIACEGFRS
jgi:DNA-binding transcriptional regulator YdaS (Cro superfamily)